MVKARSRERVSDLRKRAEKILAEDPQAIRTIAHADIEELIHDLNVHQIELEMQNEELRRVQLELEETRDKYLDLYDFAPTGYFTLDRNNLIVDVNLAGSELLGSEKQRLIGTPFTASISADSQDAFYFHYREVLKTGLKVTYELKMLKADGTPFYAQLISLAIPEKDGNINHYRTAVIDITESKRMEEVLQQSEQKFAKTFRCSPVSVCITTLERGVFVEANDIFTCITGYTSAEVIGHTALELGIWAQEDDFRRLIEEIEIKGRVLDAEVDFRTKSGEIRTWLLSAEKIDIGGEQSIIWIETDITERKQVENALQESRDFSTSLMENAPNQIVVINPDTSIKYVNPAFAKANGWSLSEAIGMKAPYPWWTEDQKVTFMEPFKATMEQGSGEGEQIVQKKNGEQYWIHMKWSSVRQDGKLAYMLVNSIDITERKLVEQSLRMSEERFRMIAETSPDYIIQTDKLGNIIYASPACKHIVGYDPEELTNHNYADFIPPSSLSATQSMLEEALTGETEHNVETEILHKNGKAIAVEASIASQIENGEVISLYAIIRDVTERRKVEEKLRESEKKFATAFRTGPAIIAITTIKDGKYVEVNDSFIHTTGYTRDELIGRSAVDINIWAHADDRIRMFRILQEKGRVINEEFDFRMKSGEIRTWLFSTEPANVAGEPCLIGISVDVTERKRAQELLKQSEAKYSSLVEKGPDGFIIIENGIIQFLNTRMTEMAGFARDEALGRKFVDFLPPEEKDQLERHLKRMSGGNVPEICETAIVAQDEHKIPVEIHASVTMYEGRPAVMAIIHDVTERKQREMTLEEESIRRRILMDQSRDGIVVLDISGKVYEANQQFARMLRYSPEEVRQLQVWDWEYQFTREKVLEMIRSVDEKGDHFETRHRRKDGTIFEVEISTNGAIFAGQKLIFCVCRDITERRKAEEQIRYQASLVDNVTDAIFSRDMNFKILSWNKAAERMYGWKAGEVIGQDIRTLFSVDFLKTDIATIQREVSEKGYWRGEALHNRRDGTPLNVTESIIIVKDSEGKAAFSVAIVTDITQEKRLEEDRQRSAKLESVGTLAGGLAHDFNNILTGILGNIQLADGYLKQNKADTAQEMLAEAEKASLRARDLTQQLLTFSRGGAPVKKAMLINRLIKESVTFALRGSRVKPEFVLPENLWAVEADEGQLNQVISNLVINADQAMPNGGIINVTASNVVTKKQQALPLPKGEYIKIAVKDQGMGIPEGSKGRIFEPYFTTKQKGSGLGLATSYSIVKNHGGCITFESKLGAGTTFHVYLPATKEKVKQEHEELSTQPLPLTEGRILVMDDEEMIRMLLSRMLKGVGHEVEFSGEGAEAIQKYTEAKESGKPFDAVILDLTVPGGMGGKEVIAKLLEIDPGVKAIVSSGYANDPIMANYKEYGFSGVVTKPYDIGRMRETLHYVLAEK